jgi:hypothetical protein
VTTPQAERVADDGKEGEAGDRRSLRVSTGRFAPGRVAS